MGESKKNDNQQESKDCCVIMPFSDPQGYEEGHFRKIYDQILKPAIEKAGYKALRIDDETGSTMIHGKLLTSLVNAPMVLCDLSAKNPNVLYELGIRHAFARPVVLVQESGQSRIFDVSGISTVEYRKERYYDEVIEDQAKICDAIKKTADAGSDFSIISLANLQPAEVDRGTPLSKEDEIKIMISDLARKIDRMEEQSAKSNEVLTPSGLSMRPMSTFDPTVNEEFSQIMEDLRSRVRNLEFAVEKNPNDPSLLGLYEQAMFVSRRARNAMAHSPCGDPKWYPEILDLRDRLLRIRTKI